MAETKPRPERFNKSRNEIREILFAQIVTSKEDDLCHREPKELTEDKLEMLAVSLVGEGQTTPLTVTETEATVTIGDTKMPAFKLVGGHRRHRALKTAIASRLDPTRIHSAMTVSVVVMIPGDDQSEEEFQQDVLVRSVTENEQRSKHTALERLEIVRQLEEAGVSIPRASASLAISATQYRRDRIVATWPWLFDAVKREEIGPSDAAQLADIAKTKNREKEFCEDFQMWVSRMRLVLEHERAEQKKLGRELKRSIMKYLDSGIVKAWKACLEKGNRFDDEAADFSFGVVLDNAKKTLTVSGITNQPIDKLKSSDVASMIVEMQAGARKLVPVMRRLQQLERATDLSDSEVEAELERVQEEVRQAAEAKAEMEAGRAPAENNDGERDEPQELGSLIDATIEDLNQE